MSGLYLPGLQYWGGWNDTDFLWLLVDSSYTPDYSSDYYIDDLVGELTDASYSRVTVTGTAISIGTGEFGQGLWYTATDPTFPTLGGAQVATRLILAKFVTSDLDSPLLAAYEINVVPDGSNVTLVRPGGVFGDFVPNQTRTWWP